MGRAGNGCATREPEPPQPPARAGGKALLAAEEMRAAGDVEDQTIPTLHSHERSEHLADFACMTQESRIGLRFGWRSFETGPERPRLGERHAGAEPRPRGHGVERGYPQRSPVLLDKDERAIILPLFSGGREVRRRQHGGCIGSPRAICRQERKPQGKITTRLTRDQLPVCRHAFRFRRSQD